MDVVLISGRQMAPLDVCTEVYVKFKFASERYKSRVSVTSLIVIIAIIVYYAAVLIGRITGPARPSVSPSVCPSRTDFQVENK